MTRQMSVAEAVLRMVKASGVPTVFGLPGVHNLAFWRCEGPDIPRIMGVRHEQTTVYAADGMARATGGLGVALTTTGPGAANAAGAFGEAAASHSPVLLIASEIPTTTARPGVMRGSLHESPDQAAIFEPLAKAVFRPRTAQAAVREAATAIETALAFPRGPVYIDIPMDVLAAVASPAEVAPPTRQEPDPAAIAAAAALVAERADVVIWAGGGGVVQSGAEAALVRLAEKLKAPVVTTFAARGAIPHAHPLAVGLPAHEPEVAALIGGADLLLAVGTDFDGPDTRNWTMPTARALLNVNCSRDDIAKNYRPDVAVVADAALALAALTEAVAARPALAHDLDGLRRRGWARILAEPSGTAARGLLDAVDAVSGKHDAAVIADMAIAGYWAGGYGAFQRSRQLQYAVGWGTLGLALPSAIGPAALRDKPVLAICGDGGFMFAVGELAVLAQEDLPVTLLLVDDGGYGMLRYDQVHAGDPVRGVELGRPDFAGLAAAFKIDAVELQQGDPALAAALDEALASGRPRLVVLRARLDPPRTISARWGDDRQPGARHHDVRRPGRPRRGAGHARPVRRGRRHGGGHRERLRRRGVRDHRGRAAQGPQGPVHGGDQGRDPGRRVRRRAAPVPRRDPPVRRGQPAPARHRPRGPVLPAPARPRHPGRGHPGGGGRPGAAGGRFGASALGPQYRDCYWNEPMFAAVGALSQIAGTAGLTLVELAYRWLRAQPMTDAVLIGASSLSQLEANLAAADGPDLPPDVAAACDEVWLGLDGPAPAYNR